MTKMNVFYILVNLVIVFYLLNDNVAAVERSQEFTYDGFVCPSVDCPALHSLMKNTYLHTVIGTTHPAAYPLLIHRVCDAFQRCIDKTV